MKPILVSTALNLALLSALHAPAETPGCFVFHESYRAYGDAESIKEMPELREFTHKADAVYLAWCSGRENADARRQIATAGSFAESWASLWKKRDGALAEEMPIQMLGFLGLTHRVPDQLSGDRQLLSEWITACSNFCFELSPPATAKDLKAIQNDLLLLPDLRNTFCGRQPKQNIEIQEMLLNAKYSVLW